MGGPQVKPGDVLAGGKYRVERVLGSGGMGVVVAARHIQLGQRVALKFMLRDALDDPGNTERFAREARAAVALQSRHTARVLDVGRLKNQAPYMVMEYLDGSDFDELLQRSGPMQPNMAVGYVLQACEAFGEAHARGMVHRDIKPKNLFLTKAVDGSPLVKVLDFGLAKTSGTLDVSLTATNAVFGSPHYMSPEQMRSAKDVDARSDIWSIGVCLYELLTGHVPFDGGGVAEICAMVLKDPVVAPSQWAPGLPEQLESAVLRCLEKDPDDRYASVAELARALEPWADEGSARRIQHVMDEAKKVVLPTIAYPSMGAVSIERTEGKTLDAWDSDSNAAAAKRRKTSSTVLLGCAAVLAMIMVVGLVAAMRQRSAVASAAPAASPSALSPPSSVELPPAAASGSATSVVALPSSTATTRAPRARPSGPKPAAKPTSTVTHPGGGSYEKM